jgi:hypothetical protein
LPFFDYARRLEDEVRDDLVAAHRSAWTRLANPGTWWNGAERVAIAAESRAAIGCGLCRERKAALSPFSLEGRHDRAGHDDSPGLQPDLLPIAAVDAIHRLVTDATRLSRSWVEGLADGGVRDTHYVELLSIVVCIRSIDAFHRAMGIEPEPLPEPIAGEPLRRRPRSAAPGVAWVPMLPSRRPPGEDADLFKGPAPYVIRAMSLVPEAVRWLKELSAAHYLSMDGAEMLDFVKGRGPLDRAQTELIAGRVSAVNECFY